MERWTASKLEFLAWWAISGGWICAIIGLIAIVFSHVFGGVIAEIIKILAIVLITIVATASFLWCAFWLDVK